MVKKSLLLDLLIGCSIALFVSLGMFSIANAWFHTPSDRIFTGVWGRSDDYVGYTSMIKGGMYGRNTMVLRSLKDNQGPSSLHIIYVWIGKVFGPFSIEAPQAYHLARAVFGTTFAIFSFLLYFFLFKNKLVAFLATLIAFTQGPWGWWTWASGKIQPNLSTYTLIDAPVTRAATRPHYTLGASIFLLLIIILLKKEKTTPLLAALSILLAVLLTWVHIASTVVLLLTCTFYGLYKVVGGRKNLDRTFRSILSSPLPWMVGGSIIGGIINQWSMGQHPDIDYYPAISPGLKALGIFSLQSFNFIDWKAIPGEIFSFGPSLWLATMGFLWLIFDKKIKNRGKNVLMFFWLVAQLGAYFFLSPLLLAEKARFVQTLFFIPMAYGTVLLFWLLGQKFGRWVLPASSIVLILFFLPQYAYTFNQSITNVTDLKNFSVFLFPTRGQKQAYDFLDSHTPRESRVLAAYEAANHIMLYTHNYVWGNPHMWMEPKASEMTSGRDTILLGTLSEKDALEYLKNNHIDYIYYGYQEQSFGGNLAKYSFLKPVFSNKEVTIYKVEPTPPSSSPS